MKRINHGKRFEQDFQASAEKVMSYIRLNDPASSFNIECNGCPKKKTRFSPKHMCDAIAYKYPHKYNLELKSTDKKSIPFSNIVRDKKDKRLQKMVDDSCRQGVHSFIIFNFRSEDNKTIFVPASNILHFINQPDFFGYPSRKSIPLKFIEACGIEIRSSLKKVRYNYVVDDLFMEF